jgi:uncharacterized protein (DUF1800 family)
MSIEHSAWVPFAPTSKNPWDVRKVAHLHRRAGFGATWTELDRDQKDGPAARVDRLLRPRAMTAEERQVLNGLRRGVLDSGDADRLKAWWLYRILYDPDPLREKLTLFWHSHFATSNRKVDNIARMLGQNELLRRHALGPFADLLTAMIGDPAMLVWLDGAGSRKEKPNENFAREFLELFTLGTGHYTEKDVREAAPRLHWLDAGWRSGPVPRRQPRRRPQDVPQADRGVEAGRRRPHHPGTAGLCRVPVQEAVSLLR